MVVRGGSQWFVVVRSGSIVVVRSGFPWWFCGGLWWFFSKNLQKKVM